MPFSPVVLTLICVALASAADQTASGAGNGRAAEIAARSRLVQTGLRALLARARDISDQSARAATIDALGNPRTCIAHRIGVGDAQKNSLLQQLAGAGLIDLASSKAFDTGVKTGVFPPVIDENTPCPKLPMPFEAAPGSTFGGHHSYPGGLVLHEATNGQSFLNLANLYRTSYGASGGSAYIRQDLVLAAPLWHDWAKPIVFQWNADGTEFAEFEFGGNGRTDAWGGAGDSRTGAHHILSLAEAIKRGLGPEFVITQASAHSAPGQGNEYKLVNWIRAGAILAGIDPVAMGYLTRDTQNRLRLPPVRALAKGVDLNAEGQANLLTEYALHYLSDSDFSESAAAVSQAQLILKKLAPQFGFDTADVARFNNQFRNVVLANTSAERLMMIYGSAGLDGVNAEISKLKKAGLF